MTLLGNISVDFDVTDQLPIRFSAFVRYWKKVGVQRDSTSSIRRVQESLWFSEEGSTVEYTCLVWNIYEISQAD
jgi:hypothetical protein